jgi:hypothetical protein
VVGTDAVPAQAAKALEAGPSIATKRATRPTRRVRGRRGSVTESEFMLSVSVPAAGR